MKNLETLLKDYADHLAERATKGIPPLPLNAEQTNCVTKLLEQDSTYDSFDLLDLLINRVPPGVDEAAYVKASWLTAIVNSEKYCKSINPEKAIEILGTMIGGYNVNSLVEILKGKNSLLAKKAAEVLKNIILVYDSANEIFELSQNNIYAKEVIDSWANAEWFKNKKINFLIGDTDGIGSDIKDKSDLILSLSPLTFPHELARLILIEQIYRAISISNNSPYHRS